MLSGVEEDEEEEGVTHMTRAQSLATRLSVDRLPDTSLLDKACPQPSGGNTQTNLKIKVYKESKFGVWAP